MDHIFRECSIKRKKLANSAYLDELTTINQHVDFVNHLADDLFVTQVSHVSDRGHWVWRVENYKSVNAICLIK